jgi:hypothetical protein
VFKDTKFKIFNAVLAQGGVVKAINAKGLAGVSIKTVEEDWTLMAKEAGWAGWPTSGCCRTALEIADREVLLRRGESGIGTQAGSRSGISFFSART